MINPSTSGPGFDRALKIGLILGLLVFIAILVAVEAAWPPLERLDSSLMHHFDQVGRAIGWWELRWEAVSAILGPTAIRIVAVIAVTILLRRNTRDRVAVTMLLFGVLGGGLIPNIIKVMVQRERPTLAMADAFGSSFPSAHAFGIVVGVLALLLLTAPRVSPTSFWILAALGAVLIGLVCFARVALAVHYLSDVLAGAGLGLAWFCGVLLVARRLLTRPLDPAPR